MKIKIDIYSGFLGAGKTYLMKKLITEGAYEKNIAIIENEFGEVSIDAAILRQSNIEVREINSGCICCQVTGDFKEAVLEVIKKYSPERIIIEPSGVAKLTDIVKVFREGKLKEISEIDNIITVIDPEKFDMYINNFKDFYQDQILNTKKIVLSRVQKLDYKEVETVVSKIRKLNRRAVIISEDWRKIKGRDILNQKDYENLSLKGNNTFKARLNKKVEEYKKADEIFETFAIYPNSEMSKSELVSKFKFISSSKNYGDILRAKGIIKLIDGSYGQFDFVKDEFEIREIKDNKNSVISFIGIKLNKDELKGLFR